MKTNKIASYYTSIYLVGRILLVKFQNFSKNINNDISTHLLPKQLRIHRKLPRTRKE